MRLKFFITTTIHVFKTHVKWDIQENNASLIEREKKKGKYEINI